MNNTNTIEEKVKYSELLSSLFCSASIFTLSILCLLNNLSLDLYTMLCLLKVVVPASISFWFLGHVIGKILDKYNKKIITKKAVDETKAYEIPSIFGSSMGESESTDDGLGGV